ncbi:DUF58 domain-containing protein [Brevibacillus sp. B_LB10_24]|uniref:DUF58 domain-containing protein n=1 Tax=Brevibacillus TaxID=55080 RepID=UPI0002E41244|nr:DUF58 domain-containing protein [Brevibacillus massiliensis]
MRQRKYGKYKIALLVLITYVFAKFQGGFASWFLFYSSLTFASYEALTYLLMFATLEVEREIEASRLRDGEDVVVTLRLRRKIWFPLGWYLLVEPLPDKLAGYYEPHRELLFPGFRREMEVRYVIPSLPRGHYVLQECVVSAGDFFGFIQRSKAFPITNDFLVYPSYRKITHWATGDGRISGVVPVPHRRSDDIAAVRGVRDYQWGDRLSQIHWRASARGLGLKTKEFEHQAMNQVVFFFDVNKLAYAGQDPQLFELAVKLAASLVYYCSRRPFPFGFIYHAQQRVAIPTGGTQAHFFRVFDQLAHVMPDGDEPFSQVIGREALEIPLGMTLAVITPSLEQRVVAQLMELSRSGRNVHLFLVHAKPLSGEEQRVLHMLTAAKVVCRPLHLSEFAELKRIGGV